MGEIGGKPEDPCQTCLSLQHDLNLAESIVLAQEKRIAELEGTISKYDRDFIRWEEAKARLHPEEETEG